MKHSVPHDLSHALAREATHHALESYRARFSEYKPQGRWITEDKAEISFSVVGSTLKGLVEVLPDRVELELDVPLMFRPFRGKALQIIEDEIKEWIRKARAGQHKA